MGKRTLMQLALCMFFMLGPLMPPLSLYAAQDPTDQDLADAVEEKMMLDRVVPFNRIQITTTAGIVTLSGTVDTLLAKQRALRVARTVRGVQSVINMIKVNPIRRTDRDIERDIKRAFSLNPVLAGRNLTPEVSNSIVTLSGKVESWPEHNAAIRLAESVSGVSEVRDGLSLILTEKRTDREIRDDVLQALRWDALVGHNRVLVTVKKGNVTLAGSVGSAAEKARALELALVNGVHQVDAENLQVAAWQRSGETTAGNAVITDSDIKKAIENTLLVDTRTSPFRISVHVEGQIVTLKGIVENLAAKRAAEQDSKNTLQVIAVKNRLKVNPNQDIEDPKIAGAVREVLTADARVDKYPIQVGVVGGIVYLTGTVDSFFERAAAESAAAQVKGVVDVKNSIKVLNPAPYIYDPSVDDFIFLQPGGS